MSSSTNKTQNLSFTINEIIVGFLTKSVIALALILSVAVVAHT